MNSILEKLLQKINRKIIFYVPKKLFESIAVVDLNVYDEIGLTSNLIIIKEDGKIESINTGLEGFLLLSKEKDLKSNCFELLKMKGEIEGKAMSYLLDNYYKELDTYITLSNYVNKNAKKEALNYVAHIQSALNLQHQVLVEHKKELRGHFGHWKALVDLERIFGSTKPKLKDRLKDKGKINNTKITGSKKVLEKGKKPPIITNDEADTYLLTSVFNVDLSLFENEN